MRSRLFLSFATLSFLALCLLVPGLHTGCRVSGQAQPAEKALLAGCRPDGLAETETDESSAQRAALRGQNFSGFVVEAAPLPPVRTESDGEVVTYTAFDGKAHRLRQFTGVYTAVLLSEGDLARLTLLRVREQIEHYDRLYTNFRHLSGREPRGDGRTRIAYVPTCGAGCGYIGYKGMEIDPGYIQERPAPAVVRHEMAHNYDFFSGHLMVGPDTAHAWTNFWDNYYNIYDRHGDWAAQLNPLDYELASVEPLLNTYLGFPGGDWATCLRDQQCNNSSTQGQGGAVLKIATLHGPAAVKRWLEWLGLTVGVRELEAAKMTPEEKSALLIESLSAATQSDLACYFTAWRWPVSDQLKTLLAGYGSNPRCQDRDGDGYSPFRGDRDDANATSFPGAPDVANGVDDDFNGVVDDVPVTEAADFPNALPAAHPVPLPAHLGGRISDAGDADYFSLTLAAPQTVSFTLKPAGAFKGWLFLFHQGSEAWKSHVYAGGAEVTLRVALGAGRWDFAVAMNTASHPGQYEVLVKEAYQWPVLQEPPPARLGPARCLTLSAPAVPPGLQGVSGLKARFWISGLGWVGQADVPPSGATTYDWVQPCTQSADALTYRVQFTDGEHPLDLTSAAAPLPALSASGCTPRTAAHVSAASYKEAGLAPDAIASAFGTSLTSGGRTAMAAALPLPTTLAETTVRVKDSHGVERLAPLFYVSPGQVNYQVPAGTAPGAAQITVISGDGSVAISTATVNPIGPAFFAANADGQGPAAAWAVRVRADGTQAYEPAAALNAASPPRFVSLPLDLGPPGERLFLQLYGTGWRHRGALSAVRVSIGGMPAQVSYAGAAPGFVGLDQVNVLIPRSLAGRGEVDVVLTADGRVANTVRVRVK